ncbi:unnamed protein product [Arabidopsis thaliana]|uniref:Transmembrane protein n=1 Tax=Arabidopsis thaliana TaxID=3702 RepID=A0A654FE30_ARATH|nr:unnamed protein product [Arabidopsis thaliana]
MTGRRGWKRKNAPNASQRAVGSTILNQRPSNLPSQYAIRTLEEDTTAALHQLLMVPGRHLYTTVLSPISLPETTWYDILYLLMLLYLYEYVEFDVLIVFARVSLLLRRLDVIVLS